MSNKYLDHLEKRAMDPLSMLAAGKLVAHGLGAHVAQNVTLAGMMRTKSLAKHIAKGFHEGAHGVVDVSKAHKLKSALAGATLPEINNLYSAAHALGGKVKPHLDQMTTKEKVGLKWLAEGKVEKLKKHSLHNSPRLKAVRDALAEHPALSNLGKQVGESKSAILTNVVPTTAKHRRIGTKLVDASSAKVSATPGIVGSLGAAAIDPVTSSLNTFKGVLNSHKFRASKIGGKISHWIENKFVNKPFEKGVNGAKETVLDRAKAVVASPVPLEAKRIGSSVSNIKQ